MATVLVIGSGGREACAAWTFAKSNKVKRVLVCPGNAGTAAAVDASEKIDNITLDGGKCE
jgi:phosphoribosylamine-glycine ligase